jgi:hypothetical protein
LRNALLPVGDVVVGASWRVDLGGSENLIGFFPRALNDLIFPGRHTTTGPVIEKQSVNYDQ